MIEVSGKKVMEAKPKISKDILLNRPPTENHLGSIVRKKYATHKLHQILHRQF